MSKPEQAKSLFKNKLFQIASCSLIDERDFGKLLYGCKDVIPDGDRERITSLSNLFQELEKRGKLNVDNREFLVDLLNTIGHKKLADELRDLNQDFIDGRTLEKIKQLKDRGRVAFKDQKFGEARDRYCEALQLVPQCSHNSVIAKERQNLTLKWIRCLIQLGKENSERTSYFQQAYDSCNNELLKQDPEDLRAKFLLAESLVGLEQYDDAYKELKILLKVKPMNPDVLLLFKEVESQINFGEQDYDDPPTTSPNEVENILGDTYPRKILLVCDKWSGWHLSLYTVNRHLCQSFGKQNGVQVACLVLDATERDVIKAKRDNIHIIKAESRSGIPSGDRRLLFMHDVFPFDVPDLVIGHGMITGAEAAELARKCKCKYLQILYDPPEECTDTEDESISIDGTEKQAEFQLGRNADFVAVIGPLLALEWSNTLNRNVMELIPGIPHGTERNSIPTPNNKCLIVKTDEALQVGLDLAIQALNDCKKRSRPVNINIQGTPRSKKDELQSYLKNKLWRSKFDVRVTSHDASIESVRGEISAVSLMMMPEKSHAFGVRGLEAISAGLPILISNTYGLAHILLKYFNEKFWKFVCPTDEEDDYESWSERIDAFFDDRDEYFRLASELREEWNKMFSWNVVAKQMLVNLSKRGCFPNISNPDVSIREFRNYSNINSSEALGFVKKELQLNEKRRKHILIVSPTKCQREHSISYLSKIPWISVFDFDAESPKTGILASCENIMKNMGLKICRLLSPAEPKDRKRKVVLPNGVPWILLEGITESKRDMNESLDWLKNIIAFIESSYHVPISILVLWNSCEENRKLEKLLFQIESSLKDRVKLSVVSTDDVKPAFLENIEKDWKITARSFSLLELGNAINEEVSENPLVGESLDFALPVTTSDGSVSVEILPEESRWVNAELEVLYQTAGDTPEHGSEDANYFYRGGTISWYALNSGYAIERESWKPIKSKIDELLTTAGTLRQTLPHGRGTGGTTSARKILFDYHNSYPCVTVKSINLSETAPAIKVLADFCKRSVLVLIDCKHVQGQEFEREMLYTSLSNLRVPCVILEIVHCHYTEVSTEECRQLVAAGNLTEGEANIFVQTYSNLRKEKTSMLKKLWYDENEELQIPFYYALVTFEEQFLGLEPFVEDCINGSNKQQRQVLIFLSLAHCYGNSTISDATLTAYLNAPIGTLLEDVLTKESMQLLIEEGGEWRPRHDLIGSKMLEKLLTYQEPNSQDRIHSDYWILRVADEAITFIDVMPEKLVSDVLLFRTPSYEKHEKPSFSELISVIPDEDDAIRVFEKAIDLFSDNMHFKVHLGRFYSIIKKEAGFSMAVKYTDEGISCTDNDTSRAVRGQFFQMKGMVYSRQVNYLIKGKADMNEIIKFAEEGVKWFKCAVSTCSDMVDGYIPEVRMMCRLFEYIHGVNGNLHEYLTQPGCHPFIVDGISHTLDTLECVPDSDNYTYWKIRVLNFGLRDKEITEALAVLEHLRTSKKASRGLINRQIASTKLEICRLQKKSLTTVANEVVELLNEALTCNKGGLERTMCIWVRIAPFVPVGLSEAESRIFKWCTNMKSLRSYLYQYIIAFINVLDKGRRDHVDLLKSTYQELNNTIKAIMRKDIGIVQHPDKAVVWLGQKSDHVDQMVYVNVPDNVSIQRRTMHVLPPEYTTRLRRLTGRITRTHPKLGTISINKLLNIKFRTDLSKPPLNSATFANRKVEFCLCFNFFGATPYNVRVIDD